MQCFVYRSSIKPGLYVYLADQDGLQNLPVAVTKQLGNPELALELTLSDTRKLSIEDPKQVMANLRKQGFHVQMPRDIEPWLKSLVSEQR